MMADEVSPCPFERSIVGPNGSVLLRRNHAHADDCATAIKRRHHPAWSRLGSDFRVVEGAEA